MPYFSEDRCVRPVNIQNHVKNNCSEESTQNTDSLTRYRLIPTKLMDI